MAVADTLARMKPLPEGVVTFLMTDVEGSTRLWEDASGAMMDGLEQHDEAIDGAIAAYNGISVKPRGEGDSRFIVFESAVDAVNGAAEMQRRLASVDWATPRPVKVRASIHTGPVELRWGDYYGSVVNRAARLRSVAHGGQTVLSEAVYAAVRDHLAEGVELRDMGQHRLKDLTRPEHVYQLDIDGLDNSFPPLASLNAFTNNLPSQLTEFIGRESQLRQIKELLRDTRLLTILAPGGSGKTRLAIQAAADLIADYPDGVFFVALADLTDAEEIVRAAAESLGIALSFEQQPESQLLGYLATKRQLLVFDNFEHLTDGATLVARILQGAPQVSAIVTTRTKLGISGETILTLDGLDTTWETPDEAFESSGVALFLDAARRVRPDFTLDADDLEPLADILRLTGGMPLAILLAAAWVGVLTIDEIAGEIATSVDFLETDLVDVPDRQRSVRAVFDYTWRLLDPEEQDVFSATSAFRGGFSREAAAAVAGASLKNLATLSGKSLVVANPDTGRYSVHELLRQYAEEELSRDPDRFGAVHNAHIAFFSSLTERAFEHLNNGDDARMLTMVEGDIENVRSAWRRALRDRNGVAALEMVGPLWMVHEARGWVAPAVELFDDALQAFAQDSDDAPPAHRNVRALSAAAQAWFLALQGEPERGLAAADTATAVLSAGGVAGARYMALLARLINSAYLYRLVDWIDVAEEGIAFGKEMDRPYWQAICMQWRGGAAIPSGDLDGAERFLLAAKEIFESLGSKYWMVGNYNHRAQVALAEGRANSAVELFTESVERGRDFAAVRIMLLSLNGLGEANLAAGDLVAAEAAFLEALATAEQMGTIREMVNVISKIAQVRASTGAPEKAVELLATVITEPASRYPALFQSVPIRETAAATLEELKTSLDPERFASAYDTGATRFYAVTVKELLKGH